MDKFIPYEKQSKKQKKAADRAKRTVWTINPITRRPENPKAYKRKKTLYRDDDLSKVLSFFAEMSLSDRQCSENMQRMIYYKIYREQAEILYEVTEPDEQLQAGALL